MHPWQKSAPRRRLKFGQGGGTGTTAHCVLDDPSSPASPSIRHSASTTGCRPGSTNHRVRHRRESAGSFILRGLRAGRHAGRGLPPHRAAPGPTCHGAIFVNQMDGVDQGHVARLRDRRAGAVLHGQASERPRHGLPGLDFSVCRAGLQRAVPHSCPAGVGGGDPELRTKPPQERVADRRAGSGQARAVTVYGSLKQTVEVS